jgi:hypothetical protein
MTPLPKNGIVQNKQHYEIRSRFFALQNHPETYKQHRVAFFIPKKIKK